MDDRRKMETVQSYPAESLLVVKLLDDITPKQAKSPAVRETKNFTEQLHQSATMQALLIKEMKQKHTLEQAHLR